MGHEERGLWRGAVELREQLLLGVGALRPGLLHEIRSADGVLRTGCERQALHRRPGSEPEPLKGRPMRRHSSATGAGSDAITSSPLARKHAAQLDPITPVPTTATRLIGSPATPRSYRRASSTAQYHHATRSSVAGWATI